MAPTICLAELPMPRVASNPYTRRRLTMRVQHSGIVKQQRLQLTQTLDARNVDAAVPQSPSSGSLSSIWEPECSYVPAVASVASSSSSLARVPADQRQHWRMLLTQREGLLDIAARTIALVRRNHILQKKVNALRTETREFIQSVMRNPKTGSDPQTQKPAYNHTEPMVSSSTEDNCSRPSPSSTPDSSTVQPNIINAEAQSISGSDDTTDESGSLQEATQVPRISSS